MTAGGSAERRADELRTQAAQARARAEALETEAGAWAAGAEGERRVGEALASLPPGWHVLHDRLLRPGRGQSNLDHVVVGPSGVYLLDTKNWAGGTSVHEGNLWQHTSASSPKGRQLDNVGRFAGEMEKALGLPVVPVVVLAGAGSASFVQQRVRGVEVVPRASLVRWLVTQPGTADPQETRLAMRRVENLYPAAAQGRSYDSEPLTVSDVLRATERSRNPGRRRRSGTRARRRRRPIASAVLALVAFLALEWLAPHVGSLVTPLMSTGSIAPAPRGHPSPTTAAKACRALTKQAIAQVTGSKTVLEDPTSMESWCTWWLAKPRYVTQSADVTVMTGDSATNRITSSGTTEPRVAMTPGEVSAWLPHNSRLPGWHATTQARQAFIVSLRFSYPNPATDAQTRAAEAAAEKKVVRLAEALAARLPAAPPG